MLWLKHSWKKGDAVTYYDIDIKLDYPDYFIDVEMKNNFLTGHMDMELFAKDTDGEFKKIAVPYWVNEDAKEEMSAASKDDLSD